MNDMERKVVKYGSTRERLANLQISLRAKKIEYVKRLLEALQPAYAQQIAKEKKQSDKYEITIEKHKDAEYQEALSFLKEQNIFTKANADLVARAFHNGSRLERGCPYANAAQYSLSDRLAHGIGKKCLPCLTKLQNGGAMSSIILPTPGMLSCTDSDSVKIVGKLMSNNADLSDYMHRNELIDALLRYFPRCSIRQMLRSFGMDDLSRYIFDRLTLYFWDEKDYRSLGLLYVAVNKYTLGESINKLRRSSGDPTRPADLDGESFLEACLTQTTCLDARRTGQSWPQYLMQVARQPRTLMNCCVLSIRRSISTNVIVKVEQLPLPPLMKSAITFTNIRGFRTTDCTCASSATQCVMDHKKCVLR